MDLNLFAEETWETIAVSSSSEKLQGLAPPSFGVSKLDDSPSFA
jgi:hypothetical protein